MLKKFKVNNFKNFKDDLVVDFNNTRDYDFNKNLIKNDLINKAIILGYNNSGKSNLGFAIMDIISHLTEILNVEINYAYPLNLETNKAVSSFEYVFSFKKGEEITYKYEKNVNRNLKSEEILINGKSAFFYDHETNKFSNSLLGGIGDNLYNKPVNISALKYVVDSSEKLSNNNLIKLIVDFAKSMVWFRSLKINDFFRNVPSGEDISNFIIKNDLIKDFQKFLYELNLYEEIDFNETAINKQLFIKKGSFATYFFDICSSGTACAALFYYRKQSSFNKTKFIFIDDFDAFYHQYLSYKLYDLLIENNSFQTIITTHNTSLVSNRLTRPDCVRILKDNTVKPLCDLTNKILREGHNLRKLMEAGEFDEK